MKSRKIEIAPSILSADFRSLEREVKSVQDAGADRIHCDIMDGHFVPNLTFGPIVVEAVKKCVSIPLDVHLMISNPDKYISSYCDAGADILTVHAETCTDLGSVIEEIRKKKVRAGVTVNPDKPVDLFIDLIDKIDQVLIMTVYAGFAGQKFIQEMTGKIKSVYETISARGLSTDLQVDGGINDSTAAICAGYGANVFVAGSYIFGAQDYREKIEAIRNAAKASQA